LKRRPVEARIAVYQALELRYAILAAGEGDIDAFGTQQDGAFEFELAAAPVQRGFQRVQCAQRYESVAGEVDNGHGIVVSLREGGILPARVEATCCRDALL